MLEHRNIADKEVTGGSDKSLGIVFGVVFCIIAFSPLLHGRPPRLWALPIAAVFFLLAFLYPGALAPLNILWTKFGALLHKIMNPIILGGVFFIALTPMALLLRIFGKRPLGLKYSHQASYWIKRNPPGPAPDSFNHQF